MARNLLFPPSVKPGIPRLGKVPVGWRSVTFGDVLEIVSRRARLADDAMYQLVTAKRNRGGIVSRDRVPGREILTKNQFYVRSGDFLISRRQIVHGACGIVPSDLDGAIVSSEYTAFRAKPGLILDYLRYYTHTTHFQRTCYHSSVGVAVEKMVFKLADWLRHTFHLPPLDGQKVIVHTLSEWDRAIEQTERLIAAKTKLKKGLMQQLLTGKRRHKEFVKSAKMVKTRFGSVPEDWPVRRLGDLAEISGGTTPSTSVASYWDGEFCWATPSDITSQPPGTTHIAATSAMITKLAFDETGVRLLQPGCVLMTSRATIGEALVNTVPIATNQGFCNFQPSSCVNAEFLAAWLRRNKHRVERLAAGSTFREVSKKALRKVEIALPPVGEQERITDLLEVVNADVRWLQQQLEKFQLQRRGLMQKLLTGQVRVKA